MASEYAIVPVENITEDMIAKGLEAYWPDVDPHHHYSNGERMVDALRAAISAAPSPWRPFSEVKESPDPILVYRKDAGILTAQFVPPYSLDDNGEPCWFTTSGEDLTGDLPSLFMPLPEPPKEDQTDA